jgi:hypothetical protein
MSDFVPSLETLHFAGLTMYHWLWPKGSLNTGMISRRTNMDVHEPFRVQALFRCTIACFRQLLLASSQSAISEQVSNWQKYATVYVILLLGAAL